MNDQTIPAAKVREARDLHRDAAKMVTITDAEREIHQHVADAMDALLSSPPTRWSLYWRTGTREIIEGPDIVTAMNNAGIGAGALAALDFYKKGAEDHAYRWSADDRRWVKEETQND